MMTKPKSVLGAVCYVQCPPRYCCVEEGGNMPGVTCHVPSKAVQYVINIIFSENTVFCEILLSTSEDHN